MCGKELTILWGICSFPSGSAVSPCLNYGGQYEELRTGGLINYPALMNYIWAYFPEYAATYNMQNQLGMHDTFGLLMSALGTEVELQNNPNEVIAMSTAAGLDFLNF